MQVVLPEVSSPFPFLFPAALFSHKDLVGTRARLVIPFCAFPLTH